MMVITVVMRLLLGYVTRVMMVMLVMGRVGIVAGYGTGAPREACWDMRPNHGEIPQLMDNCPYSIEFIGRSTHFSPGKPLTGEFFF